MSDQIKLNMSVIPEAKICSNECHKHDDGNLEQLGTESLVFCVGCGRKCHLECHKVPISLVNSVKSVPNNNRGFAYFGDMSYLRIVCDNCANMLMANVPGNTRPSFQVLFENLANKILRTQFKASIFALDDERIVPY